MEIDVNAIKEEIKRNQIINIRVSKKEKEIIQRKASEYQLKVSELARQLLLKEIVWAKENSSQEKGIIDRRTLIGLANNLNQLTKYTHQHKQISPMISEILDKINKIINI